MLSLLGLLSVASFSLFASTPFKRIKIIVFGSMFYDEIYSDCDLFPPRSWDPRDLNHFIALIALQTKKTTLVSVQGRGNVDEAGCQGGETEIRKGTWHKYRLNDEFIRENKKNEGEKNLTWIIYVPMKEAFDSDSSPRLRAFPSLFCYYLGHKWK